MARKINFNEFLIIEVTARELYTAVGSPGLCDFCAKPSANGYYVACLNQWLCPDCYEDWKTRARYYSSDRPIEERNFEYYAEKLKCQ